MSSMFLVAGGWSERNQAPPLTGWWWHIFGKRHIPGLGRLQLRKVAGCGVGEWRGVAPGVLVLLGEKGPCFVKVFVSASF